MAETSPENLVDAMLARRGGGDGLPYHRLMPRIDPEFFKAYEAWYSQIMVAERPGGLTFAERELAIIAACATLKEHYGLRIHARKAHENGVPARKIYEAGMLAGLLGGMPAMRDALAIIAEEVPAEALDL